MSPIFPTVQDKQKNTFCHCSSKNSLWDNSFLKVCLYKAGLINQTKKTGVKMSIKEAAGCRVIKTMIKILGVLLASLSSSTITIVAGDNVGVHFLHFTSHSFTFFRSFFFTVVLTDLFFCFTWPRVKTVHLFWGWVMTTYCLWRILSFFKKKKEEETWAA